MSQVTGSFVILFLEVPFTSFRCLVSILTTLKNPALLNFSTTAHLISNQISTITVCKNVSEITGIVIYSIPFKLNLFKE